MSSSRGLFGLPSLEEEERQRAIEDPGVSWKEWASSSFAKTYLGLAFFIGDAIWIASWLGPPPEYLLMIVTTAPTLYLEYLLWQYLWYQPRGASDDPAPFPGGSAGDPASVRDGIRRAVHPFKMGRWSEAARLRREGRSPPVHSPDPREFV